MPKPAHQGSTPAWKTAAQIRAAARQARTAELKRLKEEAEKRDREKTDAVVAVAAALRAHEDLVNRAEDAERAVGAAVRAAVRLMDVAQLGAGLGIPPADLRRLTRLPPPEPKQRGSSGGVEGGHPARARGSTAVAGGGHGVAPPAPG